MSQTLWLSIPSAAIAAFLVFHSLRTLGRRRAGFFWIAVIAYGLIRGMSVRWITKEGLGAHVPYEMAGARWTFAGVAPQEIAGWAIVAYLGWWLGCELTRRLTRKDHLFIAVAWACLFLGCISWAIETTAIAAGWWRWSLPADPELLFSVPWIGLVDWFFVGTDFLLPLVLMTAPALRGDRRRFLSLLLFPLHFGSHLFINPLAPAVPVPIFHLVHWGILATLIWLALRSDTVDAPFARKPGLLSLIPIFSVIVIALDLALVDLFLIREPRLLLSLIPLALSILMPFTLPGGLGLGAAALIGAAAVPPLLLTAPVTGGALLLGSNRRLARRIAPLAALAILVAAGLVHTRSARGRQNLELGLQSAIAARNAGRIAEAETILAGLTKSVPSSHVPHALIAEIYYKTGRLTEAHESYSRAVSIKTNFVDGLKHLAVIALQKGSALSAQEYASKARSLAPKDPECIYLDLRSRGGSIAAFRDASAPADSNVYVRVGMLAFESGDTDGARELLDASIALDPRFVAAYPLRLNIAFSQRDMETAGTILRLWLTHAPQDPRALEAARRMGIR